MTTEHEPSRGNPFETGGADYARHRPTYPPALVDFLADHCARTELAVDVGCGNGQLSRLLTARFAKVIATDASADQRHQYQHDRGYPDSFLRVR